MQFITMKIGGIAVDQSITPPFFVLKEQGAGRSFPVSISDSARSVTTEDGVAFQGDNPYAALLTALVKQGKMEVTEVRIRENEQKVLIGEILVSSKDREDFSITVIPGEAVVMAILFDMSVSLEQALLLNPTNFYSKAISTNPLHALESLLPQALTDKSMGKSVSTTKKNKIQ